VISSCLYKNTAHSLPQSFTIQPQSLPPLVVFHDTTPLIGNRTTGIIEVDEGIASVLGVDRSFYICIALAFWDFLADKEVRFHHPPKHTTTLIEPLLRSGLHGSCEWISKHYLYISVNRPNNSGRHSKFQFEPPWVSAVANPEPMNLPKSAQFNMA